MKQENILASRLFLAELATNSDILPSELVDEILVEYSDRKILSIMEMMEDKCHNQINEGIGLMIVGVIAWITYAKRKAEKAKEEMFNSQSKMCDHLIGKAKKDCLDNLRKNSNEKQIFTLNKYMKDCSKLKDSEDCKYQMKAEISKLKRKIKL